MRGHMQEYTELRISLQCCIWSSAFFRLADKSIMLDFRDKHCAPLRFKKVPPCSSHGYIRPLTFSKMNFL